MAKLSQFLKDASQNGDKQGDQSTAKAVENLFNMKDEELQNQEPIHATPFKLNLKANGDKPHDHESEHDHPQQVQPLKLNLNMKSDAAKASPDAVIPTNKSSDQEAVQSHSEQRASREQRLKELQEAQLRKQMERAAASKANREKEQEVPQSVEAHRVNQKPAETQRTVRAESEKNGDTKQKVQTDNARVNDLPSEAWINEAFIRSETDPKYKQIWIGYLQKAYGSDLHTMTNEKIRNGRFRIDTTGHLEILPDHDTYGKSSNALLTDKWF